MNRAPLKKSAPGTANIKALLNHADWFADLDSEAVQSHSEGTTKTPRQVRRALADGRGLVIIYVVSKDSIPQTEAAGKSRTEMGADQHFVGLGVIFPETGQTMDHGSAAYFGVTPDWEVEVTDDEDLPADVIDRGGEA